MFADSPPPPRVSGETRVMRSKEEAHDYRYFPEPDLQPLVLTSDFIARVHEEIPELPEARRKRFMDEYGLSYNDAAQLTSERALADYYERAAKASPDFRAQRFSKSLRPRATL